MNPLDTVIASLAGSRLTLGGLLKRLRADARLGPLAREALARQYLLDQARSAGLSVTTEELQQAANAYRRRAGLHTAADARAWLAQQGLSEEDFEAGLEEDLLAARLRQQPSAGVEAYYASHQEEYQLLRLGLLLVEREDLAWELASQVRDEGLDLEEVAREHGLPVVHRRLLCRDLGGPLAEALASTQPGELVGPVGTPEGFTLVVIEERRPAELDPALRQRIQDELFDNWLAGRMKEATFDLERVGTPG